MISDVVIKKLAYCYSKISIKIYIYHSKALHVKDVRSLVLSRISISYAEKRNIRLSISISLFWKIQSNIECVISLTEKQSTLVASLDAHVPPTDVGYYFEILRYPNVLILSLNWRFQKSRPLTEDIETLRSEYKEQYESALKILERTGDLTPFTCNAFEW